LAVMHATKEMEHPKIFPKTITRQIQMVLDRSDQHGSPHPPG
jgi:hypothetical protein